MRQLQCQLRCSANNCAPPTVWSERTLSVRQREEVQELLSAERSGDGWLNNDLDRRLWELSRRNRRLCHIPLSARAYTRAGGGG